MINDNNRDLITSLMICQAFRICFAELKHQDFKNMQVLKRRLNFFVMKHKREKRKLFDFATNTIIEIWEKTKIEFSKKAKCSDDLIIEVINILIVLHGTYHSILTRKSINITDTLMEKISVNIEILQDSKKQSKYELQSTDFANIIISKMYKFTNIEKEKKFTFKEITKCKH